MVLKYYLLEEDNDPGTGAETFDADLPRTETTKSLIFDVTAQQSSTTAATRTNVAAQLDEIKLGAEESQGVSEIDGEDLDAWNILHGSTGLFDSGTTDNSRIVYGTNYNLDPFMLAPQINYDQPFGLSGRVARKISVKFAADANNIDDKRLAIGIITNDLPTQGYLAFHKNSFTSSNGGNVFTDVPQPGKFLAALFFETTGAADITTTGEHRTGQTLQEVAIAINRKDVLGPVYTTTLAAHNARYEQDIQDEGYSIWNLGMYNSVSPGIPSNGGIPDNMEIRTKGGSAADAARVYAATLNTNV